MSHFDVLHPEIVVDLSGRDGNAFVLLAAVRQGLRRSGVSKDEVEQFFAEATSGDYDHLLQTCLKWVTIE